MNSDSTVAVRLRVHSVGDKEAFIAADRDPEFYRYLGCAFPSGISREEEAREWYAKKTDPKHSWAIEVDSRCVGSVWLHSIEAANRRVRLAVEIFDSRFWNRGVGRFATAAVVKFGFEELKLHRIDLRVLTTNARAIRCYERCGFVREGVQRDTVFLDGQWYSDVWMSILESEFHDRAAEQKPNQALDPTREARGSS